MMLTCSAAPVQDVTQRKLALLEPRLSRPFVGRRRGRRPRSTRRPPSASEGRFCRRFSGHEQVQDTAASCPVCEKPVFARFVERVHRPPVPTWSSLSCPSILRSIWILFSFWPPLFASSVHLDRRGHFRFSRVRRLFFIPYYYLLPWIAFMHRENRPEKNSATAWNAIASGNAMNSAAVNRAETPIRPQTNPFLPSAGNGRTNHPTLTLLTAWAAGSGPREFWVHLRL